MFQAISQWLKIVNCCQECTTLNVKIGNGNKEAVGGVHMSCGSAGETFRIFSATRTLSMCTGGYEHWSRVAKEEWQSTLSIHHYSTSFQGYMANTLDFYLMDKTIHFATSANDMSHKPYCTYVCLWNLETQALRTLIHQPKSHYSTSRLVYQYCKKYWDPVRGIHD